MSTKITAREKNSMELGVAKQLTMYVKEKWEAFDSYDLLDQLCHLVKPHH